MQKSNKGTNQNKINYSSKESSQAGERRINFHCSQEDFQNKTKKKKMVKVTNLNIKIKFPKQNYKKQEQSKNMNQSFTINSDFFLIIRR